ncbi:(d)CMP kinase [Patescibacteria group bacterium]
MIITITGNLGSGKSTVTKMLTKRLKYKRICMGEIFRKMARDNGKTIGEFFDNLGSREEKIADEYMQRQMNLNKNLIAESRVAFLWKTKNDKINIFISVDKKIGAERIFKEKREEEDFCNIDKVLKENGKRVESEKERYKKLYNLDNHHDPKHFDLIIDTTNKTPEEVTQEILDYMNSVESN